MEANKLLSKNQQYVMSILPLDSWTYKVKGINKYIFCFKSSSSNEIIHKRIIDCMIKKGLVIYNDKTRKIEKVN